MVGLLKTTILCVAAAGCWVVLAAIQAENPRACLMMPDDSYRKYQCVKDYAGIMPLMACLLKCCSQHRCIGIFHKNSSTECFLINATEKSASCLDMDWNSWTAYKKQKDLGTCGAHLMDTVGYTSLANNEDEDAEQSRLDTVPFGENEIGGFVLDKEYIMVKLSAKAKVRGIVTQGRWRNETLDGCCDERVTSFKINWSDDCDIAWVFTAADNARVFEANVIPDAGNEVVVNLFLEPVVGKCFALYVENFNIKPVLRWDVIGCEI